LFFSLLKFLNKIFCRKYAPKCAACGQPIIPIEGTSETVRVVSMDKDFHVDCYACHDCGMQLTDDPGKRCYPLNNTILCYTCHLKRLKINEILLNSSNNSTSSVPSIMQQQQHSPSYPQPQQQYHYSPISSDYYIKR
jgi:hypothetical protein